MQLDHVLFAVAELAEAGREIEARHGLASIAGGSHPAWGTANRIVPLGDAYLELVAVTDPIAATHSAFGRWVAAARPKLGQPLRWAVRTDDLDFHARRLSLSIARGSRTTPSGQLLQWRSAGIEQAAAEPLLPFFIEWGRGTPHPGHATAHRQAGTVQITQLDLTGDPDQLAAWLGNHHLPITVRPGPPAVERVTLTGNAGTIILETNPS